MSAFGGMKTATTQQRSGFFLPRTVRNGAGEIVKTAGDYTVQILACKHKVNEEGGQFFIAECKIIRSNVEERPAGTTASWVQRLNGTKQGASKSAFSNLLQFVARVLQIRGDGELAPVISEAWRQATISDENPEGEMYEVDVIGELITSDENPFRGYLVNLSCTEILTKAGTPFTRHEWSVCTDLAPALGDDEAHEYEQQNGA